MLIHVLIAILTFALLLNFWGLYKNYPKIKKYVIWKKFDRMLMESAEDGMWSSNRVAYVFTMFISNIIVWGGILFLIIYNGAFPEIPQGVIAVYGISNGIASMAKVWQKREERFTEQLDQANGVIPVIPPTDINETKD